MLLRLKKEVTEVISEKELMQRELEVRRLNNSKDLASLTEERDRLLYERGSMERQLADLKDT